MGNFKRLTMPLAKIKANQQNPRIISESKLKKLINSLLVFPKMMTLRPITLDENDFVLGGNMRQTALNRIAQMSKEQLQETIEQAGEYQAMTDDERQATLKYWLRFLKKPQVEVQVASDLTEDERQQFIIKDNVSFGDWDYDELESWDKERLDAWGVDTTIPDFGFSESDDLQQKIHKNNELDVDGFGDKIKFVLELSIEEHAFIQNLLSQDGMTKEQVLLNLLGYAEQ